jgi:hypothetical protein
LRCRSQLALQSYPHRVALGCADPWPGFSTALSQTTPEPFADHRLFEFRCPHQFSTPLTLFNYAAFCHGSLSPGTHLNLLPSERSGAANCVVRGRVTAPRLCRSHPSWCASCSRCVRKIREWSSRKLERVVCAVISNLDTSSDFRLCGPSK